MTGRRIGRAQGRPAQCSQRWITAASLLMTVLFSSQDVYAQLGQGQLGQVGPPIFDPSGRSGEPPAPLKKEFERPEPPPTPSPVLPPPPLPPEESAEQRLGQIKVFVKDIQVVGNTAFTQAQIDEVTAPFENRTLTTEDLERLRLSLTVKYLNAGYLTSGAIIPDQDVKDGIVTVQVIEGKLTRIDVSGNRYFADSYLRTRVEKGVHTPVSLEPLQEQLQLLQQDRRIERINAELHPGDTQGESRLHMKVVDRNPFHAYIEGNNYQVPLVGEFRGLGTVVYDNVTGHGDPFSLTFGGSAGAFPIIDTSYAIPLNRYDTTFSPYYRRTDYTLIEEPFTPLDIKTNTEIIGLSLRQPVYRTVTDEVTLSIIGEHLFTQSFIFSDIPFNLFPGFQNGAATVSALRFAQEWTHRTTDTVVAGRSRFSVGLNVLGATINSGDLPSGQFFSWLGQIQGIKQFGAKLLGMQLLGRMDLQLSNSPLFPLEQVSVGGRYSVRGYREVTLLRDNAFIASVESRFPLWRRASGEPIFQLAPFADVGNGWSLGANKTASEAIGNPSTLASIGAGLRWNILPHDRANYEVYWGYKLVRDPPNRVGNTLQDYGVHMGLVINLF